jgi:hypothetical protein
MHGGLASSVLKYRLGLSNDLSETTILSPPSVCMNLNSKQQGRSNLFLRFLLFVLHSFVVYQEITSRYLHQGFAWTKKVFQYNITGNSCHRSPSTARSRGKKPNFPTTIALVIAEDLPGQQLLDRVANLVHWYGLTYSWNCDCLSQQPEPNGSVEGRSETSKAKR